MKISTLMSYSSGYIGATNEIVEMEKAGLDVVWIPEAYSFDAVSAMGYMAAKTDRVTIASGILNIYSRTPTLLAMTAAGIDALSEGRCMLGLGASGPQVIEGFHGIPYDAPMTRIREIVEICRMVWRREEKLVYNGKKYHFPIPADQGTGLGIPLKIINHPYREEIPIALATLGEKSVEMTAEIADAWLPAFFMPEGADAIWGKALARGNAKRDVARAPLDIYAGGSVAIGEGLESYRDMARPGIALYVGGMGAKEKNFYNQVFRKYGYEEEAEAIQTLYLSGRKSEAEAAIPQSYLDATSLIGSEGFVRDRLQVLQESGVTSLNIAFLGTTTEERVRNCDALRNLLEKI
ncbi:MAG: LLM class F420-dependent oxidoreductase [Pseudomonadales bacterium]|jgi:F420-dependent oxidoreductase-like protein|nr:LLM class F420-dependent oxidoreductase [Pseudomonadales bacterium]MDP7144219.1 LLM class F420-dependent oxidoreductase [Pseudomonadales bacterium]MDP7358850.1 LLM class F420-dependent oxidoreductase [Pseudomonadales bacterium]MDP7594370.1 LLM class F420-dependent oxidoreductase [Pseudomonadales bacterium]HJN49075.1 LLM class F420-dependent oxidoreductase [Pseudomonadales bacterium]|tara:strand:- start:6220 stop:7269 length:1050 start_codon:yes stop_codon:yes gene_type:complete